MEVKQLEQLSEYRWVDKQKGVVEVHIKRAMERIVEDARAGRPASPPPTAPPPPAGAGKNGEKKGEGARP